MADYTLRIPTFQGSDYVAKIEGLCNDLQTDINGAIIPVTSNITINAPLNLDTLAADVAINNDKETNATHFGDVAGSTTLTIQPNAVETAMISNNQVTFAKIQDVGTLSVLGRNAGGTGDAKALTVEELVTMLNNTIGTRVIASDADTLDSVQGTSYLRSDANDTFSAQLLTISNVLHIKELEETAISVTTAASMNLNPALGTYFYLSAAFSGGTSRTFTFGTPAVSGRVTTMTLELNNAADAPTITWPTSVEWPNGGSQPVYTTGKDIITFVTRDAGASWVAFVGGTNFA